MSYLKIGLFMLFLAVVVVLGAPVWRIAGASVWSWLPVAILLCAFVLGGIDLLLAEHFWDALYRNGVRSEVAIAEVLAGALSSLGAVLWLIVLLTKLGLAIGLGVALATVFFWTWVSHGAERHRWGGDKNSYLLGDLMSLLRPQKQ